jgi:hypothetical protein
MTDYRALCAELLDRATLAQDLLVREGLWEGGEDEGLFDRARAEMAKPDARRSSAKNLPPVHLTAPECIWLYLNGANEWLPFKDEDDVVWSPDQIDSTDIPYIRADLILPTPEPVPVSERPWEREGWCDERGMLWAWNSGVMWWDWVVFRFVAHETDDPYTHCLPYWAIPLP